MAIFLLVVAPARPSYAIIDYHRMHHGTLLPFGSVAVVLSTSFPVWLVLRSRSRMAVFPDGLLAVEAWWPGRWR